MNKIAIEIKTVRVFKDIIEGSKYIELLEKEAGYKMPKWIKADGTKYSVLKDDKAETFLTALELK